MKNSIKSFSGIILFFLFYSQFIYSQSIGEGEFMIINKSSNTINVSIYPSGAIFNGNNEYNLYAYNYINEGDYIYPTEIITLDPYNTGNYFKRANFDKTIEHSDCHFSLGYGAYIVKISDGSNPENLFYVNFSDANFCDPNFPNYYHKIKVNYYGFNNIKYNFCNGENNYSEVPINDLEQIRVWEQQGVYPPQSFIPNKGNYTDAPIPDFHNWPVNAHSYSALDHECPQNVNLNLKLINHNASMYVPENTQIVFWRCVFEITNGLTFIVDGGINYGGQLHFSGQDAKLVTGINSIVKFSSGTWLCIKENAIIEANYTTFQAVNEGTQWECISLNGAGSAFFDHCTFNDARLSISAENCNLNFLSFTNNYFYIPHTLSSTNYGIGITKGGNFLISDNHFYFPDDPNESNVGIGIFNNVNSEEDNNLGPWFKMHIIHNDFYGGNIHILERGLADNNVSTYINRNKFIDGKCNIDLNYASGIISNNEIENNIPYSQYYDSKCIYLFKGAPNFFNNTINSNYVNFTSIGRSFPNFAPAQLNEEYIWIAGKNTMKSLKTHNIYPSDPNGQGNVFTDYGKNKFTIDWYNGISPKHIYGFINDFTENYNSSGNCWYGSFNGLPVVLLFRSDYSSIPFYHDPNIDCNYGEQITNQIITDLGNGIYDTIQITQANNTPLPNEEVTLYGTAIKNQIMKNYSPAIQNYKILLDNYPNSKHLESTIFKLYECYVSLDTNHTQGWRNVIFNDLKSFLENKIQQYQNNSEFVNVAFDFLLKSKIKIKGYQSAMDGYDFIANNSPSATERLMASINYIDVEGLLQGSSGGQTENQDFSDELSSDINGKPIKDILLASYNKTKEQIKQREKNDLKNSSDVATTKAELNKKHSYDKKLESRALENISISGSLTKSERKERIQKDLMLLHNRDGYTSKKTKSEISATIKYELSQNYPNPFNPVTNIKYQIQKTGLVTLKIYDITGREIKTLVNEIKNPGSYLVSFNGTEFASGVYFYRIQSGDFVQVKKMLLIK